ncbi:Zinc finger C2H2-type [Trinorchestia longiramus]|nr:Zinc finger C2H2-type [Trinorchestia longiramus]
MDLIGSQSLGSHMKKQQPPHEQLQEQRSELKKILEEHRLKEAEEELSLFDNNVDVQATGHNVVEVANHNYEDFLSEGLTEPSFAVPKPVQVLNDDEAAFLASSSTQQPSEFGLHGKQQASLPVHLEANDLATLTNINLHCNYTNECEVISKDLTSYPTAPEVLSLYPGVPEESTFVYPVDNQTNLTNQFSPALQKNDYDPSGSARKSLISDSVSIGEPELVCASDLDSNSAADGILPLTVFESPDPAYVASEHMTLSGDSLHHLKKTPTTYAVPSSSDPTDTVCNSFGEPRDCTAATNEPESSFTSDSYNITHKEHKNAEASKTVNVTVIGPDSLAVPMKRCRKEYFKLQKENVSFKKPMLLQCEWGECIATFSDSKKFLSHVGLHLSQYEEEETEENECSWHLCDTKWQDYEEFKRHIFFHAFHTHLKAKGEQLRVYQSLPACYLDTRGQNSVPQIPQAFECQYEGCNEIFQSAHYFYWHVAMHINNMDVSLEDGKEFFKCRWGECKAGYNRRSRLVEHCQSHTQEKLFACNNCGNMFSSKGRFVDHLLKQIPPDELQYQCSCCGRKYATERMVRDHLRHHINHYKCPHCEMTCSSQSSLDTHILYRHSNRKLHPCAHCSKSFKQREDLERHLLAHTDNKLFKCYYADCAFRSKCSASLDSHIKQRHLKVRVVYACHLCSVERTRGNALSQHLMKTHSLSWPTGHSKFFYRLDNEGKFRLQTVRYESLELEEGVDRYATEKTKSDESAVPEGDYRLGESQFDGGQKDQKSPSKRKRGVPKQRKQTLSTTCKARVPPKTKRKKADVTKNEPKASTCGNGPRRKTNKNPKNVSPKKRTKAGGGRKKKNAAQRGGAKRGRKKLEPQTPGSARGRKRKATSLASDESKVIPTSKKRKNDLTCVESNEAELLQTPQKHESNATCTERNQLEVLLTAAKSRNDLTGVESLRPELLETPMMQGNESNKSFTSSNSPEYSPFFASMPIIA